MSGEIDHTVYNSLKKSGIEETDAFHVARKIWINTEAIEEVKDKVDKIEVAVEPIANIYKGAKWILLVLAALVVTKLGEGVYHLLF